MNIGFSVLLLLFMGTALAQEHLEPTGSIQGVHDPVIMEEDGRFYLFGTGSGIPIRCSDDLIVWRGCSAVFFGLPTWIREAVPTVTGLWAPDISFYNGRYQVYYSASSFGDNQSAIGLATNATLSPDSPDYAWQDEGLVIQSQRSDDWNAIDPNFVLDGEGQPWLTFGSFWSGIKLVRLDPETRKLSADDTTLYGIASRRLGSTAVEAPFIIYREPYYYLFVSFDQCCEGVNSTYNIRVGRSREIIGPYLDASDVPMLEGGGTLVLGSGERWQGPGHNAVINHESQDILVYHAYDTEAGGASKLRLAYIFWESGWPLIKH